MANIYSNAHQHGLLLFLPLFCKHWIFVELWKIRKICLYDYNLPKFSLSPCSTRFYTRISYLNALTFSSVTKSRGFFQIFQLEKICIFWPLFCFKIIYISISGIIIAVITNLLIEKLYNYKIISNFDYNYKIISNFQSKFDLSQRTFLLSDLMINNKF